MSMVLSSSNLHFLYSEGDRSGKNNPSPSPFTHLSESGSLKPEPSRASEIVSNVDVGKQASHSNNSFVEAEDCEVEAEEREIVVSSPEEAKETGYGEIIGVGKITIPKKDWEKYGIPWLGVSEFIGSHWDYEYDDAPAASSSCLLVTRIITTEAFSLRPHPHQSCFPPLRRRQPFLLP
ncbi:hypothetical protein PM082_024907 [Marasmius tenuissimus]|nr:hypothetical protein PM082_024907 [Marasmius tenuissimus]